MLFYDGSYDRPSCINGKSKGKLPSLCEAICLPLNQVECEIDHTNGDRRDARSANLQALHGHCHDAKTRGHRDYLPLGMRDQHQDTEERREAKVSRSVLEQR